jgi:hypothetical protein
MTPKTLRMCHQVIGQIPAKDAKQAIALAEVLAEIEMEIGKPDQLEKEARTVVMQPDNGAPVARPRHRSVKGAAKGAAKDSAEGAAEGA